jgi:hypothetical protein
MQEQEVFTLYRLKALAICALLVLHLLLSFTWIPQLYGIWPISVEAPSISLTGFASFLNLFGLLLFFILSGYTLRKKALNQERYLLQKANKNMWRFFKYYTLLSLIFYLLLSFSEGRFLAFEECTFLVSFYHLWFIVALAGFQLLLFLVQRLNSALIKNLRIPVALPLCIHALGLYGQGGVFLKTPTQLAAATLLSIVVYFFWFLYGFSRPKGPLHLCSRFSLQRLLSCILVLGIYFLAKTALIFSWNFTTFWQLLSSCIDPLTFIAALNISLWLFEVANKKQYAIDSTRLQYFLLRFQLPIYVFQIPLIFVLISIQEIFGCRLFLTEKYNSQVPNWQEAPSTWILFHILLIIFALLMWLLWHFSKQKTPHSKEQGV